MVPPTSDCDACIPGGKKQAFSTVVFASLPFLLTFLLVSTLVLQKLVPLLSGPTALHGREKSTLLGGDRARWFSFSHLGLRPSSRPPIKRVSAFAFSTTIALAAVLAELILCEISNTMNPAARGLAFRLTVSLLLFLLVFAIPFLEIHSVITAAGYEFTGPGQGRLRLAWVLQLAGFTAWLLGFWWSGERLLGTRATHPAATGHPDRLTEACLERVGVIGISFMSLLSGFASVSSPWHNLFSRPRPVTETDLARKQAGLEATTEMLGSKRSRLQALERKMSDGPRESFFHQALGSIRGNAEQTERRTLELEIAGLETMSVALSASRALQQSRLRDQTRARTPTGRLIVAGSSVFSLFCLYRILSTSLTAIRRLLTRPSSSPDGGAGGGGGPRPFTPSDPVNHILALLAKHYDPHLDQAARARQISFFLSGLILAASVSSAMQTFRLLARFAPRLLRAVQANLPLLVAQVCATYLISAALILGGMMPGQVLGDGLRALGGPEMAWVDAWFERCFLLGVFLTAGGIWLGRKWGSGGVDGDIYGAFDYDDDDDGFDDGSGGLEEGGGGKRS